MSACQWREDADRHRGTCPGCQGDEFLQVESETNVACVLWCATCDTVSSLHPGSETLTLLFAGDPAKDQRNPRMTPQLKRSLAVARGESIYKSRLAGRSNEDAAFDLGIPGRSARRNLEMFYEANPHIERIPTGCAAELVERDLEIVEMVDSAEPGDGQDWLTVASAFGINRKTARDAYTRVTGKPHTEIFAKSMARLKFGTFTINPEKAAQRAA